MTGSIAVVLQNEALLVARVSEEPAAFAAIYDHYFPRVYNYIRYRVGDSETTDDLTSTVFERTLANIRTYDPARAPFAAWLFAIARNVVNDHLRAQRRRMLLHGRSTADASGLSTEARPEDSLVGKETYQELLGALNQISERERNLIGLKFGAGLSNRHIARITGLSESNVAVIVFRAIRKLRKELDLGEAHYR